MLRQFTVDFYLLLTLKHYTLEKIVFWTGNKVGIDTTLLPDASDLILYNLRKELSELQFPHE